MTEDQVLKAIENSGAIISTVANRLGCAWYTARKYCAQWDSTKRALQDEEEKIIDMAEGTLLKSIKDGDIQSSKWFLATKGKKRGYSEKHEIEHSGHIESEPTVFIIETKEIH